MSGKLVGYLPEWTTVEALVNTVGLMRDEKGSTYEVNTATWDEPVHRVLHRADSGLLLSLLPWAFFLCPTIFEPNLYSGLANTQSLGYLLADARVWVVLN